MGWRRRESTFSSYNVYLPSFYRPPFSYYLFFFFLVPFRRKFFPRALLIPFLLWFKSFPKISNQKKIKIHRLNLPNFSTFFKFEFLKFEWKTYRLRWWWLRRWGREPSWTTFESDRDEFLKLKRRTSPPKWLKDKKCVSGRRRRRRNQTRGGEERWSRSWHETGKVSFGNGEKTDVFYIGERELERTKWVGLRAAGKPSQGCIGNTHRNTVLVGGNHLQGPTIFLRT